MTPWKQRLAVLITLTGIEAKAGALSWNELQQLLHNSNPEIKAAASAEKTQQFQSRGSWAPFLPEVSASAGYAKENTLHDRDEGYVGYLSSNWNLFRGGRDWNILKTGFLELEIARFESEIVRRRLTRELGENYLEAQLNLHFIALDTEKLQFLRNLRAMAQKKIDAGLTSNVDAIELDLEESTLSTEIETHQTDLKIALERIKALINAEEPVQLQKSPFPQVTSKDFSNADLAENPQLKKYDRLQEVARRNRQAHQAEYLPSVDLQAQYGRLVPQYADPLDGTESRIALLMTWNFFAGLRTHNQTAASVAAEESRIQETRNQQRILNAELSAISEKARELLRLRDLLEKRQSLSQKYYDLTLAEYRRGVKNSSDLANATSSLFENKTRLIEVQKRLAVLKLKFEELTK